MYKGQVFPDSELNMTVAAKEFSNVHVYLTSLTGRIKLESVNITLERRVFKLRSKNEWAFEKEGVGRETFYGTRDAWNLGVCFLIILLAGSQVIFIFF